TTSIGGFTEASFTRTTATTRRITTTIRRTGTTPRPTTGTARATAPTTPAWTAARTRGSRSRHPDPGPSVAPSVDDAYGARSIDVASTRFASSLIVPITMTKSPVVSC